MKRKIFIILLAITAALCCAFALAACDNGSSNDNPPDNNPLGSGNEPGTSKPSEQEPDHEHQFGDWVVITEPTCTEEGERRQSCNCGTFKTEKIDALGHDLKYTAAKPFTCTEDGWNAYEECQRENCGHTTKEIYPAHHVYENRSCKVCHRFQADIQLSEDGKSYIFTGFGDLTETDVVIPAEINGIPVTAIGEGAFRGTEVTSVEIPETITVISEEMFENCKSLNKVIIPDTITSIGGGAFTGCDQLDFNEKENGNYFGSAAHPYLALISVKDKTIESYTIDAETKIIYYEAFDGCENLKSITIPETVTELGASAFSNCTSLESVNLPNSIELIADFTFMGCTALKTIEIPTSVKRIAPLSFWGCTALENIEIPSSVTSIGFSAFDSSGLKEITIPESVTELEAAFNYCEQLEKVYILGNITEIADDTFRECPKLSEIVLPASLTHIGAGAFFSSGSGDLQENVYFLGTKEQWDSVIIDDMNNHVQNANVYFYSGNSPIKNHGSYWHFVGRFPVIWTTEN